MRQCTKCEEWKELEEFAWKDKQKNIRHYVCKTCMAKRSSDWYKNNKERQLENVRRNSEAAKEQAQRFIYEYLSFQKCKDCGTYDFAVLTFDHVKGKKKMDVMQMVNMGYSIEAIKEEIFKCDVVCYNCHMLREQKRRGGGRFEKFWPKRPQDD
jgi:hypothetical protein